MFLQKSHDFGAEASESFTLSKEEPTLGWNETVVRLLLLLFHLKCRYECTRTKNIVPNLIQEGVIHCTVLGVSDVAWYISISDTDWGWF